MSDATPEAALPASFQVMLRAAGTADFKRAGSARLAAVPMRGSMIEIACDGRMLRGVVDAIFIPPGCEENCVGTVFLSEG
ncbi:MAG TPA: hypothetical protein VGP48_12000 [Stellaceae bacterium]|jgi:hypothetical protein|nr:hypothetical protein [Stellaceae bacterium]